MFGVCLLSGFSARCLSVSILSAVRILSDFRKKAVRCLSARPDKDETELSGLSLSLSVDVCFLIIKSEMSHCDPKTLEIGFVVADR